MRYRDRIVELIWTRLASRRRRYQALIPTSPSTQGDRHGQRRAKRQSETKKPKKEKIKVICRSTEPEGAEAGSRPWVTGKKK
jgi:hypothetical protein